MFAVAADCERHELRYTAETVQFFGVFKLQGHYIDRLAELNMPTLDYLLEQSQTTVADLAKASGLEAPRVQAIVDGRWTPSPDERQAIATALGMPVENVAFGHNMNARNIRFHRFGLKEDFNASGDEQRE